MQTDRVSRGRIRISDETLLRIALGCGVFPLFGLVAPRTSWTRGSQQPVNISTDGAGWDALVVLGGIIVIGALVIAFYARRWRIFAAHVAVVAFAVSAYIAGSYGIAILRGALYEDVVQWGPKWTVHPTPAPPFFALVAVIGMVIALALAIRWRRPYDS